MRRSASFAVEHELHVAGPFELLKDQFVHPAARIDQGSADDGQRTAFFECPCRGEEFLGDVHRFDVDAAAHRASGIADPLVECPGEPRDRIHQHEDVFAHFGETLTSFHHQLGQADMALDVAIEAAGEHLAVRRCAACRSLLPAARR